MKTKRYKMLFTDAVASTVPGEFRENAHIRFQFRGNRHVALRVYEAIMDAMAEKGHSSPGDEE